ncbi:hypothetical protein SAMN05421823_102547 [Catalinimonas alkaloidigena]|uniref:Uncharacterized protein n=2 Tax=Catalinimonas alkaloidigena TaxID=1075417 RepID=A0A1G9B8G3_9BACT|nr:hypothetical protein SAMN05421823_102547 [Catalinimonas alkaloidigena]
MSIEQWKRTALAYALVYFKNQDTPRKFYSRSRGSPAHQALDEAVASLVSMCHRLGMERIRGVVVKRNEGKGFDDELLRKYSQKNGWQKGVPP